MKTKNSKKKLTQREIGLRHGFRSGLEDLVADQITNAGFPLSYEELTFRYTVPERLSRYTPDFILPNGIVVETKGQFKTDDRQKHLLIKAQFPDLELRFVFSNPRQRISKTSQTTYANWCEKHGFEYAKGCIPTKWFCEPAWPSQVGALEDLGYKIPEMSTHVIPEGRAGRDPLAYPGS